MTEETTKEVTEAVVEPEVVETAVEPVVEETQEAAAVPKPSEDADPAIWGDSGSEVGNSVLGYLQEAGVTPDEAKALLYDALQSGDLGAIDKAALVAKLGKNGANIVLAGAKSFLAERQTHAAAVVNDIHTAVGGKEAWDKIAGWASENISETDLAQYRPMIDKGGAAARFAATEITALYNKDSKNSSIQVTNTRAEATSASPPARTAYTRAQYVEALDKAHKTRASQKEFDAIQAARNAGRKQGL